MDIWGYNTMWTDEKHNIYLEHLEVSFVKQLHQSISLLDKCSDQDEGERSISQIHQINDAQPHGCCKKIKCNRGCLLSNVLADSVGHIESQRLYRNKRIGMKRPARTPQPHGSDTCSSHQNSASTKYCDSKREGTGQNFVDEQHESNSNTAKRTKAFSPPD
ncbi:cold-regulated protein 28-like [Salvia hispanica]|uniref:cold-regulated protein 28-like n=1 Tax=Salvia hispanica TaxID=49212 RepID=UPI0020098606|nr:cold-regulated protein 28-like [Salvia hispanica]XP_047967258.1 cold-regulated protein 28-like [Salvia hispanica]XP_047967259.1 cold-regulated protein 28-like [Salvia hispanica]XP_047967260.1 cold-regulated protein 28-like [Salvia hispanica]